eukprot:GHVS01034008.1.p1 GENE.GHVS01034008.1~~GHVS01034008.1.p1  ORF type:complete len:100 (-),score=4.29 GHVS01034008.1:320-619(-)
MYTVDLSLSGDKGGGHLLIRRHEFSERLAGSSNFRELDRTPVHLRTVLPLQMRLPPAVRNKAIFDEDLPTQCFEGLLFRKHSIQCLPDINWVTVSFGHT